MTGPLPRGEGRASESERTQAALQLLPRKFLLLVDRDHVHVDELERSYLVTRLIILDWLRVSGCTLLAPGPLVCDHFTAPLCSVRYTDL